MRYYIINGKKDAILSFSETNGKIDYVSYFSLWDFREIFYSFGDTKEKAQSLLADKFNQDKEVTIIDENQLKRLLIQQTLMG